MIQPQIVATTTLFIFIKRGADTVHHLRWSVADAHDPRAGSILDSLRNQTCWIGEVDQPCMRAEPLDRFCLLHGDGHSSQGHGNTSRPSRLLAGIAMLDRHPLVVRASLVASSANAA